MRSLLFLAVAAFLFATTRGAGFEFSYDAQGVWPGVCLVNTGRQSPVNIQTGSVVLNASLMPLELGAGWDMPVNGTFGSLGHNVQFSPNSVTNPDVTTTIQHLSGGTYRVVQMHFHWGSDDATGSEHTVNGRQYALEVHIVQARVPPRPLGSGDALAVIGVFAEAADIAVSGVWEQLNASAVRVYPTSINVSNFVYSSLLPSSLEYYHYVGSLTTPGCDEVVQWFVLKEPIQVPRTYLEYLRQVESSNENETLTFNFRQIQPLGSRSVYTTASSASHVIVSSFSMLVAMFVTMAVYLSF